jgi:hypothetical protein
MMVVYLGNESSPHDIFRQVNFATAASCLHATATVKNKSAAMLSAQLRMKAS